MYDERYTIYFVFTGNEFLPLVIKHCIFRPRLGPNDLFLDQIDAICLCNYNYNDNLQWLPFKAVLQWEHDKMHFAKASNV